MEANNADIEAIVDPGPDATGADLYKAGLAYSTGHGAPMSYVDAHKWFNLAALAGVGEAKVYRKELSELMSSGEIAEAQASARQWMTDAAHGRARAATEAATPVHADEPVEAPRAETAAVAAPEKVAA